MRMWMVDPVRMCDQHLLGEHVEIHMLAGNLARRRSISGYMEKGLLEPASMQQRHDDLVAEMSARGFRHASPLEACDSENPVFSDNARVDRQAALAELHRRCDKCRSRER